MLVLLFYWSINIFSQRPTQLTTRKNNMYMSCYELSSSTDVKYIRTQSDNICNVHPMRNMYTNIIAASVYVKSVVFVLVIVYCSKFE